MRLRRTGRNDHVPMSSLSIADSYADHELVQVVTDRASGLRAVIAVHSTQAGPGMGGIRRTTYASIGHALIDALRLSRAMTLKNVTAGLPLGGAKAVVIDDGRGDAHERLAALGRAIDRLGGRYVGAEDIGTTPEDMEELAAYTSYVAGRPVAAGGSGDPSPATARTVLHACLAALRPAPGPRALQGISAGIVGVGKVGAALAHSLHALGADLVVSDTDRERVTGLAADLGATVLPTEALLAQPLDLVAPCAEGALLDASVVAGLRARVVCGAANNQLVSDDLAEELHERRILYVPDFVANAGGIVQVGGEHLGWDAARIEEGLKAAEARCDTLLDDARAADVPPLKRAAQLAASRLSGLEAVA